MKGGREEGRRKGEGGTDVGRKGRGREGVGRREG